MDGGRLDLGRVLEQSFQDVDGFPDAARDEVAEQSYVGICHMVVGNSTISPITDRILSQEAVLCQVVSGPVRGSRTSTAPDLREIAAVVGIDEILDNGIELVNTHVAPIGERQFVSCSQTLQVTRCLGRT